MLLTMDQITPVALLLAAVGACSAGLAPLVRALRPAWLPWWRRHAEGE
jgi:hypothetical protein